MCAFRNAGVRQCDISVAVQKDGIHGNQKLKITESCYTVQWRWKPDGGRPVNHTLKDGGGGGEGGNMYGISFMRKGGGIPIFFLKTRCITSVNNNFF